MKFSEFYKLLEEHGWRKDGGSPLNCQGWFLNEGSQLNKITI